VNWDPKISGTHEYGAPGRVGDVQGRARDRVLKLARELERDLERAQRREVAA
jgi:hypothetical protein